MSRSIQIKAIAVLLILSVSCTTAPKIEHATDLPSNPRPFGYPTGIPVEYLSRSLDAAETRKVWDEFCIGKSSRRNITVNFDYILPAPGLGNAALAATELTRIKKMLPLAVKRFFYTKMKSGNPYQGSIVNPNDFHQLVSSTPRGRMDLDEDDRPYTPFSDYAKYVRVGESDRVTIFWSNIDHRIVPILEKDGAVYFEKLSEHGTREFGVFDDMGKSAKIKYENIVGPFDFFSISLKPVEIKKTYYPPLNKFENVPGTIWPISRDTFGPMALLMNNFTMLVPVAVQEQLGWRTNRSDQTGFYVDGDGHLDPKRVQITLNLHNWNSSQPSLGGTVEADLLWTAYVDKFLEIQFNPSSIANAYSIKSTLDLEKFCKYGISYNNLMAN